MTNLKAVAAVAAFFLPISLAAADVTFTDLYIIGKPAGSTSGGSANELPGSAFGGQLAGQAFYNVTPSGSQYHAELWTPANPNAIDLNPLTGFSGSQASATNGSQQVGYGSGSITGNNAHALLWSGTNSPIDLNPSSAIRQSFAVGLSSSQQVGFSVDFATNTTHATLWNGTAASAVDLQPTAGFAQSYANNTDGIHQVGYGKVAGSPYEHALLWSGTGASAVDLNLSGKITDAQAFGTRGNQQVGVGSGKLTGDNGSALLWTGTAASVVSLQPSGNYSSSGAVATNGTQQVGYIKGSATGQYDHACLWSGTAGSFIDLQAALPKTFEFSNANSIVGNTVYGTAYDTSGTGHAVMWTVPGIGDVNGDAKIDIADLGLLATYYGQSGTNIPGDINNDGTVNIADLGILATNYGYGTSGPQLSLAAAEHELGFNAIPEPAMLSLAMLAVPLCRRRR